MGSISSLFSGMAVSATVSWFLDQKRTSGIGDHCHPKTPDPAAAHLTQETTVHQPMAHGVPIPPVVQDQHPHTTTAPLVSTHLSSVRYPIGAGTTVTQCPHTTSTLHTKSAMLIQMQEFTNGTELICTTTQQIQPIRAVLPTLMLPVLFTSPWHPDPLLTRKRSRSTGGRSSLNSSRP